MNLTELYGDVLNFSIVISTTATGPTQTIWTHHGSFYPPNGSFVVINPPKPGTYFWRLCANNPSKFSVGVGGAIGPDTPTTVQNGSIAVMPPNGILCGGGFSVPTNRQGISTQAGTGTPVPVLWFDVGFDQDVNQLNGTSCNVNGFGEFDCVNTAKLNDNVQSQSGWSTTCVINNSTTTVQVSMNQ